MTLASKSEKDRYDQIISQFSEIQACASDDDMTDLKLRLFPSEHGVAIEVKADIPNTPPFAILMEHADAARLIADIQKAIDLGPTIANLGLDS